MNGTLFALKTNIFCMVKARNPIFGKNRISLFKKIFTKPEIRFLAKIGFLCLKKFSRCQKSDFWQKSDFFV